MSPAEVEFCRDIQGFIEFALRNGLSLPVVLTTVGHDINNLMRYGMSLEEARADVFDPKVSGYARVGSDSVGEAEEIEG
jgi:hypothetical protein